MVNVFDEYLKCKDILMLNGFLEIYNEMISEIGNDEDAIELYGDFIEKATVYASYRAKWMQLTRNEKLDMDKARTACHDAIIIRLNTLSRYLKSVGKSIAWRDRLGYTEDDTAKRKTIGDFACFVVFLNSLYAR